MTPAIRRLLTLRRDTRAATAVEFALLITPLIMLILASLQLSIIFYAGQVLQSGAMGASRALMTGSAQTAKLSADQYRTQYVCANITFMFNCNNVYVDVQSFSSYSGITNTAPPTLSYKNGVVDPTQFNYSTGNPGDVIILRVMYNWPVVGGPLLPGLSDASGNHLLVATSVFKTEPY